MDEAAAGGLCVGITVDIERTDGEFRYNNINKYISFNRY